MSTEAGEAREIVDARLRELEAMEWDELDRLDREGVQTEEVVTASGRRFQVETTVFWDMEEWNSGMELGVEVHTINESGLGEVRGGWSTRGGPGDPVPDPPGGWDSPTPAAWAASSFLLIALIIGIGIVGVWIAGATDLGTLGVGVLLVLASGFLLIRVRTRRRPIRDRE